MADVKIILPGRDPVPVKLVPGTYRIGASPASHIMLTAPGVEAKHCQLIVGDTLSVRIFSPVTINGTIFTEGEQPVPAGAILGIGEAKLLAPGIANSAPQPEKKGLFSGETLSREEKPSPQETGRESAGTPSPSEEKLQLGEPEEIPVLAVSGIPPEARPLVQKIKRLAHEELLKRLNLKRMLMSGTDPAVLEGKAKETIHEIMSELTVPLPHGVTLEKIEHEMIHEAIGLGPLEDLIAMDNISEIMVNGPDSVYVETKGKLHKTDMAFVNNDQVIAAIERIVSPLGRRIDESSPMVDARLKDGSRVNAIIPPLSLVGPSITIRKFSKKPLKVQDLVRFGSISYDMANFLNVCVKLRKNIIISGGTGSGKTTLLNILSSFLPDTERIITIEDAAELQLRQDHVVRLEARPANIEGKGEVSIRDLVRNSLRMRPDRIVIGECRGGEALDMLQAMNTGHDGSLTTIHANSPRDALARLETLVLMAGFDLPLRAIREQIASAISIIVQINREKDGSRKVTSISEITRMEGDMITMQEIFLYHQDGWSSDGRMTGRYVPTGSLPSFMDDVQRAGLKLDLEIFSKNRIGITGQGA